MTCVFMEVAVFMGDSLELLAGLFIYNKWH
jgi:hypothetical protein